MRVPPGMMVVLGAALVGGCAPMVPMSVTPSVPRSVPTVLEPPPGEALAMEVAAKGVQIYQCRANAGGQEWMFVAPEADLMDARGMTIGRHGAGPSWVANDGSRIEGVATARTDAPSAGAIPWLLLATRSTGPAGTFGNVTSVQRVDTAGGVAPSSGCDAGRVGESARVPYTATYRLFAARRAEWMPRWAREVANG